MSVEQRKAPLKGDALVNKVALIVIEIICVALIFGYISDYIAGYASKIYFIIFEITAILTAIIIPVTYKTRPSKMKYIAFTCFSLVYLVALYRPAIDLVFVMAFPIVIVFVLYYDFKLMCIMSATFMTITLWDCIKLMFIMKKHHSGLPLNSSVLLMEFLATGIFLGATTIVTRISKQNNDEKIHEIQTVADRVNTSIKEINVEIGTLNDSSIAAKHAMEEINSGISSAAEAVQNQLLQTEAIQDRIGNVQEAADKIDQNVDLTMSAVVATEISNMSTQTKEATDNISDLIHNATTSLDDLVASVTEMSSVIQSEKDQTVQTSEIFGTIQNSTEEVRNHVSLFIDYIHGLTDANREIVQSVSTISATTQEVTALTSEALSKEHANAESVSSIAEQIGSLAQNE